MNNDTGPSHVAKRSPDPFLGYFPEMDDVSRGDYLEWNDLIDPVSRSSSSANSSCSTMTSEECFDPMALLRELEDDKMVQEMKDSSVKFNLCASAKSKEVVIRPATSGSLRNAEEHTPSTEAASKVDPRNERTSNGHNTTASSSSSEGASKEGKKEGVGEKMMKYLCFMAF